MIFGHLKIENNVPCQMRDGVTLYADIYRPNDFLDYPVLLMRQPYGRMLASTVTYAHPTWFARQGYMVVIQDVRGRGDSEGEFMPFMNDVEDGYDTVAWAAQLPYSNGNVGMYGFSYQGTTQWAAASAQPPQLKAIAPAMCAADLYPGMFYPHGRFGIGNFLRWAFQLARDQARRTGDVDAEAYCSIIMRDPSAVLHELPLLQEHPILKNHFPFYYEWVQHPTYDAYWQARNWLKPIIASKKSIPALHIAGWFDNFLTGTLQTYDALQEIEQDHVHHRLIIGPWAHIPWGRKAGGKDYGIHADARLNQEHLNWFDHWLKGKETAPKVENPIQYYELGSDTWKSVSNRKLMEAKADDASCSIWYFESNGLPANGASGGGVLQQMAMTTEQYADVFVYDSRLTMACASYMPQDRSTLQDRYEILNYTSTSLRQELHILGAAKLSVYAQVMGGPSDLVAILSIVNRDGAARFLSIGRAEIPARSDETDDDAWSLMEITMRPFAAAFQPGSAIRIELTGSAYPLFVQHPNAISEQDIPKMTASDLKMAATAIEIDRERPAKISLPLQQ